MTDRKKIRELLYPGGGHPKIVPFVRSQPCDLCLVLMSGEVMVREFFDPVARPEGDAGVWMVLGVALFLSHHGARANREPPYVVWTCDAHHEQLAQIREAQKLLADPEADKN